MPPETKPVPNPSNEARIKGKQLVKEFENHEIFYHGYPVVMNKTARTALLIMRREIPYVEDLVVTSYKNTDEERRHKKKEYASIYRSRDEANNKVKKFYMAISDEKPDMSSEERKLDIQILSQKMNLKPEDITEDMISTSAMLRIVYFYLTDKDKTLDVLDKERQDLKSGFREAGSKYNGKPEDKGLFLTKLKREAPYILEADDFAVEWMKDNIYLFEPGINTYLGQWSGESEQQQSPQAGVVFP